MSPVSLVLTATDVIVAFRNWWIAIGELVSIPKAGGAGTPLASFGSAPSRVVTDGVTIAWATATGVGILPASPGPAIPLAASVSPVVDLTIDDDRLVWIESPTRCCSGSVQAVALAGGPSHPIGPAAGPLRIARAGDGSLYWTEGGHWNPADPALNRWTEADGIHTLIGGLVSSGAIAVDADHVYVTQDWWIKRVPRGGGAPERFALAGSMVLDVALDADHVYWLVGPQAKVLRRAKAGGPIELVSTGPGSPLSLVVAQEQVVWIGAPDELRIAPVTGGPSVPFASGIEFPTSLATDGEFIYFYAQDSGQIRRQALAGGPA
jgi:hypothetical protein